MSDRPPSRSDDLSLGGLVDEVVSQVRVALDEADVTSKRSRELLLDGLRDVMGALDPASLVRPEAAGAPDVTVVPGGRDDDSPPSEGPIPDLRVAEPDPTSAGAPKAGETGSSKTQTAGPVPTVRTHVRVHNLPPRTDALPRLQLAATADTAEPAWSPVFRGSMPRPYRLVAERNAVLVRLDADAVERIPAGGSLDVEAAVIHVAAAAAPASVRVERLPS